VGATWGRHPHNFSAVGAIAPMESAPMTRDQFLVPKYTDMSMKH